MLKLSANKEKQLTFEIQIGGVTNFDQVQSFFRISYDDVEYGFPCKVTNESIQVTLPPLNKVIAKRIKEGDEVDIKLEVVVDGLYLIPWQDRARLSNPLVIEAKIKDNEFVKNASFSTTLIQDKGGQKQGVIIKEKEEDLTSDFIDKLVEKLASKLSTTKEEPIVEIKEGKTKDVKKDMDVVVSEKLDKIPSKHKLKKKYNGMSLNELKNRLTKEDVFRYMDRAGTKNKQVQEVIYEQAEVAAKGSRPIDILKQVIKVLSKKKR